MMVIGGRPVHEEKIDPPGDTERALGVRTQLADPGGQVQAVPDQQQAAGEQPKRHQRGRRRRARARRHPERERTGRPRHDDHRRRLDAHEPMDQLRSVMYFGAVPHSAAQDKRRARGAT
jgi:hypothetical protein